LKKIAVVFALFLTLAMLATPVLALGPKKAKSNPNVDFPLYGGVALDSPSGVHQEWTIGTKHLMWLDAREFKRQSIEVVDVSQVAEFENKWLYFSATIYGDWLAAVLGAPPGSQNWIGLHIWASTNFPYGVYYREVLVG
jgi:hypothetical protein